MKIEERINKLLKIGRECNKISYEAAAEAIKLTTLAEMEKSLEATKNEIDYINGIRIGYILETETRATLIDLIIDAIYREAEIYELIKAAQKISWEEQA